MSTAGFKATFTPQRAYLDHLGQVFDQDGISAEFEVSLVHDSLFFVQPKCRLRVFLVRLVNHWLFQSVILGLILLNSLALALDDPSIQDNSSLNVVLNVFDIVVLAIFIAEMACKVIAIGFVLHPYSYCRDIWNVLDLVVILTGIVNLFLLDAGGVAALRTVRIFRPLRTVAKVKSMRRIMTRVMLALPRLRDVFVLLVFVTWLAAIGGVQLFLGVLNQRCYYDARFFDASSGAAVAQPASTGLPQWELAKNVTNVCSLGSFGFQCGADAGLTIPVECMTTSAYTRQVLSFDNIGLGFLLGFKVLTGDDWPVNVAEVTSGTSNVSFLYFFVVNFFGGYFCLNLFIAVLTSAFSQGSREDDTVFVDKRMPFSVVIGGAVVADAACIAPLAFGVDDCPSSEDEDDEDAFAALPLPAAALRQAEAEAQGDETADADPEAAHDAKETEIGPEQQTEMVRLTTDMGDPIGTGETPAEDTEPYGRGNVTIDLDTTDFGNAMDVTGDEDMKKHRRHKHRSVYKAPKTKSIRQRIRAFFKLRGWGIMYSVVKSVPYGALIMFVIFVNAVILSLDSHNASEGIKDTVFITSFTCNIIFLVDVTLKIVGLGPSFLRSWSNWFDLTLALASIPELITYNSSALSALRAFRLIRLLRVARRFKALQELVDLVIVSVQSVASLSLVALVVIYIYAILGFNLIDRDVQGARFSFKTVFDSLMTVFTIVTGENWASTMQAIVVAQGWWTVVYFLTLYVFGNFFIANLFIAIIIDAYEVVVEEDDDEDTPGSISQLVAARTERRELAASSKAREYLEPEGFSSSGSDAFGADDALLLEESNSSQATIGRDGDRRLGSTSRLGRSVSTGATRPPEKAPPKDPALAAAEVVAERLSVATHEEFGVVQEFVQESGRPEELRILGNPAELSLRAERELLHLEEVRGGRGDMRRRLYGNMQNALHRLLQGGDGVSSLVEEHRRKKKSSMMTWAEQQVYADAWHGLSEVAFRCVPPDNTVRLTLAWALQSSGGMCGILSTALGGVVLVALDNDDVFADGSTGRDVVSWAYLGFIVLLATEMVARCIALGFAFHPGAYLRSVLNCVDVVVLSAAIAQFWYPPVRALVALRVTRLMMISFNMQIVVTALVQSLPGMTSVLVFMILLWWIYAVLGVSLFKGLFYECSDSTVPRSLCNGTFNGTIDTVTGPAPAVLQREWYSPYNSAKFDNVAQALFTLLKMSFSDNWFTLMYYAVDSNGVDNPKERNATPANALYFISFMIVGNFFTVNLFVGVLTNRFVALRQRGEGFNVISEAQRQWVMAQKVMFRSQLQIRPEPPENFFRAGCFAVCESAWFDRFFTFLIILNSVVLSMYFFEMPKEYEQALDTTGLCILCFFTVEMGMKLAAYNPVLYWRDRWNRLDAAIVMLSWVGFFIGNGIEAIRLFRVLRLFLLLRKMKGVQTLFVTLYQAIPELINVGVVLMVAFVLFAVLGVFLFNGVRRTEPLSSLVNFDHLGTALVTLYISTTTEGWADITDALRISEPRCTSGVDCGSWLAVPFMITFMIVMNWALMQLLITVVLGNFLDALFAEGQEGLFDTIDDIRGRWEEYDVLGLMTADVSVVLRLLPTLPTSIYDKVPPLVCGRRVPLWVHQLRQLERFYIPIARDHKVHYMDVVASVAFRLFCISVREAVEASQRTTHGVTWEGRQLSIHHHFAAIKLTRVVRRFLQSRGERMLRQQLHAMQEQQAVMLQVEFQPLRQSHRDTTVMCRWLIHRLAEERRRTAALQAQVDASRVKGEFAGALLAPTSPTAATASASPQRYDRSMPLDRRGDEGRVLLAPDSDDE